MTTCVQKLGRRLLECACALLAVLLMGVVTAAQEAVSDEPAANAVPGDQRSAISGNLLPNPSFDAAGEAGRDETLLSGWSLHFRNDPGQPGLLPAEVVVVDDARHSHSGRHYLRLRPRSRSLTLQSPAREGDYPAGLYEVSAWARGTPGTRAGLGLYCLNAALGAGFAGLDEHWQKYSTICYFPGGSCADTRLAIVVFMPGEREQIAEPSIDIDDVVVRRLSCGLADTLGDHMVLQRDRPLPIRGWAEKPGQRIQLAFNGQTRSAVADKDGRWLAMLEAMPAGGPFVLELDGQAVAYDVLLGDVWICSGQSNMEFGIDKLNGVFGHAPEAIAAADHPQIRLWHASRQFSVRAQQSYRIRQSVGWDAYQARWSICSPTTVARGKWGGFSAVGYFFGREIQDDQKVPIGLMQVCEGGTPIESFISEEGLRQIPQSQRIVPSLAQAAQDNLQNTPLPAVPAGIAPACEAYAEQIAGHVAWNSMLGVVDDQKRTYNYASAVYNGVAAPVFPTAVRGVLWYQGENNSLDRHYEPKLKALIADWRTRLGDPKLPFLIAQLCNFRSPQANDGFHYIREAQLHVSQSVPHTALAVTIDLADREGDGYGPGEIHPKQKQAVGHRLALAARALAYGEPIVASGPLYRSMKVEGEAIRLTFDPASSELQISKSGLPAADARLTGFTIAGNDRQFVAADATLDGKTIVVRSAAVKQPKAVRYNFQSFADPLGNLANRAGLPASPFRTDDWE